MNATRAATIRGRAWVGGVVSLGRVQTPTLAMIVKREREIQAFVPEPYWLVHAPFDPRYEGLWFEGDEVRLKDGERADGDRREGLRQGRASSSRSSARSSPSARRSSTTSPRSSATRTAASASPRAARSRPRSRCTRARRRSPTRARARASSRATSSRSSSRRPPRCSRSRSTPAPPASSLGLEQLPLGRVVNDAKVDDHHAIIPTDVAHDLHSFTPDERRIFDLIARRFLAVFHPPARYAAHDRRHRGRGRALPHPRQGHARRRLARCLRARGRRRPAALRTRRTRRAASCRRSSRARRSRASRPRASARRRSRRRATPRRRCSRRWRRPAS